MKIKGINTGAKKGEVIQLNPTEKVVALLKDAIPLMAGENEVWWCEDITVKTVDVTRGRPNEKGYDNNSYNAEGTFKIRKMLKDRLQRPKPLLYRVSFKDILDSNGLPDLELVRYEDQPL